MITLSNDQLDIHFPHHGGGSRVLINFQRTLRVPDCGRRFHLPPGLGRFPLRHVEDYDLGSSEHMKVRGGVIMPMFQTDAVWLNFRTQGPVYPTLPVALKIGTGKINAVSGEKWTSGLSREPQNHVVLPGQRWLDGYNVGNGIVRQFVAMPMGKGYTVEEQIDLGSDVGGIQIEAIPLKDGVYGRLAVRGSAPQVLYSLNKDPNMEMGLGAGGSIRQQIYQNEYGLEDWDLESGVRCFVMLLNSSQWMSVTNEAPPLRAISAKLYSNAGLPWFDYYDRDRRAIDGAIQLGKIKPIKALSEEKNMNILRKECDQFDYFVIPIDFAAFEPILREAFFPVERRKVYTQPPGAEQEFRLVNPPRFAIVDVDREHTFSIVDPSHIPVTNRLAYEFGVLLITKIIHGSHYSEVSCEHVILPKNRSYCHIDLTHPKAGFNFTAGKIGTEEWTGVVRVTNSYDGSRSLCFEIGFYRLICKNGMMGERRVKFRIDLTRDVDAQLDEIAMEVGTFSNLRSSLICRLESLLKLPLSKKDMFLVFCHAFDFKTTRVAILPRINRRNLAALHDRIILLTDKYFGEMGCNAYAALNVLTEIASRPEGLIGSIHRTHHLQRRISLWADKFTDRYTSSDYHHSDRGTALYHLIPFLEQYRRSAESIESCTVPLQPEADNDDL